MAEEIVAEVPIPDNPPCSTTFGVLEAIYLKIVEASPDAKIVINDTGAIVVFNQQAGFLFGYDRTEIIGKQIEMLLPESVAS